MRGGYRKPHRVALIALTLLPSFMPAFADEPANAAPATSTPTPDVPRPQLRAPSTEAELRTALKNAQRVYFAYRDIRSSAEVNQDRSKDRFGRIYSEDIFRNILTLQAKRTIESLIQNANDALGAHNLVAAQAAIDELGVKLGAEADQYTAIQRYWTTLAIGWPDRAPYLENLRKNGLTPHLQTEIEAMDGELRDRLAAGRFIDALSKTYPALQALYRDAASQDAAEIEAVLNRGQPYEPLLSEEGAGNCSKVTPISGSKHVTIVASAPATVSTYPTSSKSQGAEGRARLYVIVSAEGCLVRAMVTVTSGWPDLDASALRWALKSKYAPAAIDSQPVTQGWGIWMDFKLEN